MQTASGEGAASLSPAAAGLSDDGGRVGAFGRPARDERAIAGTSRGFDIGSAIDRSGWSRLQAGVLVMTSLSIIFDGFDNQSLGFVLPALLKEWHLPKSAFAPVLSISLIGMTCGAALTGVLGDRFGRKGMLGLCVAVFGLMTALCALSSSLLILGMLRFVAALGLGGAMPNAAALIAEYAPRRSRGLAVSFAAVCVPLGGFFGGLIAASVLPAFGWRVMFAVAGLLPLAYSVLLVFALPESPRFLLQRGDVRGRLRGLFRSMGIDVAADAVFADTETRPVERSPVRVLFEPEYRRDTIALAASFFFCLLATYACFNWLPTLIAQAGYGLDVASLALTIFNSGGVVAAIAGGWAVGRVGSRSVLLGLAGVGIVAAVCLVGGARGEAAMLVLLAFLGASIAGAQSVLTALAADCYPTAFRATGIGFSIGFGRAGGIASAFVGAAFLTLGGQTGFFAMLGIAMLCAGVGVLSIKRHVKR